MSQQPSLSMRQKGIATLSENGSMILQLDDKFRVVSDRHNFILQEKTSAEKARGRMKNRAKGGKWRDIGYWKQLDQLLRAYTRQKLRCSAAQGTQDVLTILAQINVKIDLIEKQVTTHFRKGTLR